MPRLLLIAAILAVAARVNAQTPRVPLDVSGVVASGPARVGAVITDEGQRGYLRGQETGSFTLWTPNDVIRDVRLSFETTNPRLVVAGSSIAKSVVVRPEGTTVVYSHPTFTVREHIFVALEAPAAMLLLQVDAVQPLTIVVHSSAGDRVIAVDPARAASELFPVVLASPGFAPSGTVAQYWQQKVAHYRSVRSGAVSLESADARFNQALEWGKANVAQRLDRMMHVDAARYYAPYFILAMFEQWVSTGDDAALRASWRDVVQALQTELRDTAAATAALRPAALDAVEQMARALNDAAVAHAAETPSVDTATSSLPAMAFGLLDSDVSERLLLEIAAAQHTTDWGVRVADGSAVSPFASGLAALAHYRQHRGWAGIDLLRDVARATFDFTRGRPPQLLSGTYYQATTSRAPHLMFATTFLVAPIVRGLIGWETDAPHNAAALEPHLPADVPEMAISGLRVGRDRLNVTLARVKGVYSVGIHRITTGAPLSLRVAPALPLGAHVDRIVVNDQDVPVQTEESLHDVHAVIELPLVQDAQIEVHYRGGIDVMPTVERVDVGAASHELRTLDFRADGRDYILTVEGLAASLYTVQLLSDVPVRSVEGADSFAQKQDRVTIHTTLPAGSGFVRKTLRIRT